MEQKLDRSQEHLYNSKEQAEIYLYGNLLVTVLLYSGSLRYLLPNKKT